MMRSSSLAVVIGVAYEAPQVLVGDRHSVLLKTRCIPSYLLSEQFNVTKAMNN
jgi:hypothetical protein